MQEHHSSERSLTLRAVAIGLSLIGLFAWWIQENNLVLDGPKLVEVVPPATAVVALGLLVAFSALLGRRGLRKGELLEHYQPGGSHSGS